MKSQPGNGSGKFQIHTDDMGGWVRTFPGQKHGLPDDLPLYLSATLTEWFRQRPQLRLRFIVPIQRDGNTVELHAWFDVHVMPPTQLTPNPD